jgi:GNAT superfamily N-acetyltransferase
MRIKQGPCYSRDAVESLTSVFHHLVADAWDNSFHKDRWLPLRTCFEKLGDRLALGLALADALDAGVVEGIQFLVALALISGHAWHRRICRVLNADRRVNYEIVRYHPDLKTEIIKLQTFLWGPDLTLNTLYFEWKYERNPYLKEPLIYLAMHNGKVIGMRGFFGVQWQCGLPVQRFYGLYADDMVIAPEHRGRGLMSKIMTSAFEYLIASGYEYVFNLSAADVTLHSSLNMGWRNAGWLQPMRWRSRRNAAWSGLLRRAMRLRFASHGLTRLGLTPSRRALKDVDLRRVNRVLRHFPNISFHEIPRCADMADLVERVGDTRRIAHVRNREYFQWRFQNPQSRYRFLFWQERRLEGYLVLQEYASEHDGRNVLNIVDWEASCLAIKARLMQATISAFAGTVPVMIWSATLPRPEIELLQNTGFRSLKPPRDPLRSPPAILVRPINQAQLHDEWKLGNQPLLDLASWDMRMLYSMSG